MFTKQDHLARRMTGWGERNACPKRVTPVVQVPRTQKMLDKHPNQASNLGWDGDARDAPDKPAGPAELLSSGFNKSPGLNNNGE